MRCEYDLKKISTQIDGEKISFDIKLLIIQPLIRKNIFWFTSSQNKKITLVKISFARFET